MPPEGLKEELESPATTTTVGVVVKDSEDKDDKELAVERTETVGPETDSSERSSNQQEEKQTGEHLNSLPERMAKRMARTPCAHLLVSMVLAIGLSAIGLIVGGFSVAVDNAGWQSRGTLIANRQTQLMLTQFNMERLFYGDESDWEDLIENVQPGWESGEEDTWDRRLLEQLDPHTTWRSSTSTTFLSPITGEKHSMQRADPLQMTPDLKRKLQQVVADDQLPGCSISWYDDYSADYHLWPIWKTRIADTTALSPDIIFDLCESEQETQRILEERELCFGCEDGCLPPFGLVFYARLTVPDGMKLTCAELRNAWGPYEDETREDWTRCVTEIKANYTEGANLPLSCPFGFTTDLVQYDFDESELVMYTSSIFPTREDDVDALYDISDKFSKGTDAIEGAYDTRGEDFSIIFTDSAVARE
jgi:hypothetical protein